GLPLAGVRPGSPARRAGRRRRASVAARRAAPANRGCGPRMLDPRHWQVIDFSGLAAPRLVVLVDAEEEFDWGEPFPPPNPRVSNIAAQHRAHRIFDLYGIVPTYMVDYPVARQRDGYRPLAELQHDGRAGIGAQLHPWVTPPFTEEVTVRNSFAGNLPRALE